MAASLLLHLSGTTIIFEACAYGYGVWRRKLFQHTWNPWEGDNVGLKTDLIRVMKQCPELTATENGHIPHFSLSCSNAKVGICLNLDRVERGGGEYGNVPPRDTITRKGSVANSKLMR
jgi:hypothetical protein